MDVDEDVDLGGVRKESVDGEVRPVGPGAEPTNHHDHQGQPKILFTAE